MNRKTKKYLGVIGILTLILLPRLLFLFNGPDHQRMQDVLLPTMAFNFLNAVKEHRLGDFLFSYKQYPLLGSYAFVPTIGIYYLSGRVVSVYSSVSDFITSHALRKDNIFFAFRLEMLIINIAGLAILYFLTKRFTKNSATAGLWALLFAGLNFQLTIFSVAPRLHAFVFFSSSLALYASYRLLEKKGMKDYLFAFGSTAVVFSISQTGLISFILPLLAHFYDNNEHRWRFFDYRNYLNKNLIYGIAFFTFFSVLVGYPKFLVTPLSQLSSHEIKNIVLTGSRYVDFSYSPASLLHYLKNYFINAELLTTFVVLMGIFCLSLDAYGIIALAFIITCILLILSSVTFSDRYGLVFLPSVFYLAAGITVRLKQKRWFLYPLLILVAVYLYGWINTVIIAGGGDTREMAVNYLLKNTNGKDAILGNLDKNFLGITATPESIRAGTTGPSGTSDELIAEKNMVSSDSRNYFYLDSRTDKNSWPDPKPFKYAVVAANEANLYTVKKYLSENGFVVVKSFFAKYNENDTGSADIIPWDMVTPPIFHLLPIKLGEFKALGPNVFIFQKID